MSFRSALGFAARFALPFCLFARAAGLGQSTPPSIHSGPPPSWVIPADLASIVAAPDPDADRESDGLHYVLVDRQHHAGEGVSFFRFRYRLTSEGGVQEHSTVRANYDPAYQTVVWHHLRIERGGDELDRFEPARFLTLQQERQLDRHVYNGRLSQVCLLEDVRVGDTIDFAFSVHGFNPVFGGRVADSFSVGWSIPLDRVHERWLIPAGRTLRWRAHGIALAPWQQTLTDGTEEWIWQRDSIAAIDFEADTPLWAVPYPFVEISEWSDWREVISWGVPLYPTDGELPEDWRGRAVALATRHPDPRDLAVVLLRLVQEEVRYLAITPGEGTHRPSPVADVCARRFGDCKDKSVLLSTLLNAVGIEAWPALVETDWRARVADRLPSPLAFDHVVVQLRIGNETYTVDPTLNHQRGRIDRIHLPNYGRALPLRSGATGLVEIFQRPGTINRVASTETFRSGIAYADPAELFVETVYEGGEADAMRRYFAETRRDVIGRRYTEYYAQTYPAIEQVFPPEFDDDVVNNRFVVTERYRVPDFWAPIPGSERRKATVGVATLRGVTNHPARVSRTKPLALAYPDERGHTVRVHLPEPWEDEVLEEAIDGPGFEFRFHSEIHGQTATLAYRWRTTADHVSAADTPTYARKLAEVREYLDYQFTTGTSVDAAFTLDWLSSLLVGGTLVGGTFWIVGLLRRRGPPPIKPEPPLAGLGGWLILVGIGMVIAPVTQLGALIVGAEDYFSAETIAATANPFWEHHHPWWPTALRAEATLTALILVVATAASLTFFRRQRQFPILFVALIALQVLDLGLQWALHHYLPGFDATTGKELVRETFQVAGQCLIWVPYMFVSERVKLTFVR